jgi:hypothetical protein
LDEEVAAIDPIEVFEERFVHQDEVFVYLEIIHLSSLKYHVVEPLIVDIVG